MTWSSSLFAGTLFLFVLTYKLLLHPLFISSLSRIPGPKSYALTKWRLAYDEWRGARTRTIHHLHQQYGPVIRIGPNEVHFNSHTALNTIYGAGSGFERTEFYRMFDPYGRQTAFTFGPGHLHAARKKLLAGFYSRSNVIRGSVGGEIEGQVRKYVDVVESTLERGNEIFRSLHWYSLDNTTNIIYGPHHGGTSAMRGNKEHQALLDDILEPSRRQLAWCGVHFPNLTNWLFSPTRVIEKILHPFSPVEKPATYTRIRAHGLKAMRDFAHGMSEGHTVGDSVISRLWESREKSGLSDLDIAAECADHLLAGILTTSDTLVFLIWALSLPENLQYQEKLIEEARAIPAAGLNDDGNPTVETALALPYLDAVVKETLRLYAPLPASEPRHRSEDIRIDGYLIPSRTVVSMQPYSLHRNPDIFPNPLKWNPERWLAGSEEVSMMKKWWWPFSSGGRMCSGVHVALAEMAVIPAVYRKYRTRIRPGFEGVTPAITSRFELFYDDTFEKIEEHTCWIKFDKL